MNRLSREAMLAERALQYHELLLRVRPRKPDLGVRLLLEKALRLEQAEGLPLAAALQRVYQECERRVERMLEVAARHGCSLARAPARKGGG